MVLTALDRIMCFHLVTHITTFCDLYANFVKGTLLQSLVDLNTASEVHSSGRFKTFDVCASRFTPILPPFSVTLSKASFSHYS